MTIFINMIFLILSIAFYTLIERKFLGMIQSRLGPNKPSFLGLITPLTDAFKLLLKYKISLKSSINFYVMIGPIISFTMMLLMWLMNSSFYQESIQYSILWVMGISSLSVYGVFLSSWGSSSKYSFIGGLRSIAQTISFEIASGILLLSLMMNIMKFDINVFFHYPMMTIWGLPLLIMWMIMVLIETNRSPFDLIEGESELVSGFNTEYGGLKFALLFLAEYGIMIFMSMFTHNLFFGSYYNIFFIIMLTFFLLIRGTFPRFRYDVLMNTMWIFMLPLTIIFLMLTI